MKQLRRLLVGVLAPTLALALTGCYESTTKVELSVDDNDELLVEVEHTHWLDIEDGGDEAEANQFLEDFNADSRLVRSRSLTAPNRIGAEYQATITEEELQSGPVTIEVAYGTLTVVSETVFGSRKVEIDLDSSLEFGIEPNSSIEVIGPEYWMTNYGSTNSNVWMQPTDDELDLGWSRYGASFEDGSQPWTVNVFYEEPAETEEETEPAPEPEPEPEPEPVQEEQTESEGEALPEQDSADAATSEISDANANESQEQEIEQSAPESETEVVEQDSDSSPISFAVWMVLILILAVVVGLAVYLIRSRRN